MGAEFVEGAFVETNGMSLCPTNLISHFARCVALREPRPTSSRKLVTNITTFGFGYRFTGEMRLRQLLPQWIRLPRPLGQRK
jgi:hypothetical protein